MLLDELAAVHPHSVPGPMTATPDGDIQYVAEAGVIAVIDATTQAGHETAIKVVPISSQGVRAVELLLDPDADVKENPTAPEALLYVAGGRQASGNT